MAPVRGRLASTFSSLRIRNYRIFFLAQLVSVTGTWMQSVAQMWLVLHLTGSGVALGLTTALQFLPVLLLGPWGGLVADRADKRRLLMVTQSAAGVLALMLALLTLTGLVRLWMVFLFAAGLGMVSVLDNPARQSFVGEMVGRGRLANAVSLNSAVFTLARVIGPAAAGVLIGLVGTGWCFLYNGLSYFPVALGLLLMRPSELHRGPPVARGRGQVVEGLRYAWRRPELRVPLLLMLVIGLLGFNFNVLLPLLARFTFHSGAGAFGALLSLMGAGSFAGALLAAGRSQPTHRLLAGAALAFGLLLIAAALAPALPVEGAVLVPMGAAMITFQATANSLIQVNSSPSFRGRVMALYVVVFVGSTPIGGPLVGWVAQTFSPRAGLALGGIAAVLAAALTLWYLRRAPIQPRVESTPAGGAAPEVAGGSSSPAMPRLGG